MAKAKIETTSDEFDAEALLAIDLDELDENEPTLPDGRWAVQLISYKVEQKTGKTGPYMQVLSTLYPVEPVNVEEPGNQYDEIPLFVRHRLTEVRDQRAAKRFLMAFGAGSGKLLSKDDSGNWDSPAYEMARGNVAHVTAEEVYSKFFKRMETKLTGFSAPAEVA